MNNKPPAPPPGSGASAAEWNAFAAGATGPSSASGAPSGAPPNPMCGSSAEALGEESSTFSATLAGGLQVCGGSHFVAGGPTNVGAPGPQSTSEAAALASQSTAGVLLNEKPRASSQQQTGRQQASLPASQPPQLSQPQSQQLNGRGSSSNVSSGFSVAQGEAGSSATRTLGSTGLASGQKQPAVPQQPPPSVSQGLFSSSSQGNPQSSPQSGGAGYAMAGGSRLGPPLAPSVRLRPWEALAAALAHKWSPGMDRESLAQILMALGNALSPVSTAEVLVFMGKLLAVTPSSQEQLDGACAAVLEAIEMAVGSRPNGVGSDGGSPAAVDWSQVFLSLPQVDRSLKIDSLECFAFLMAAFGRRARPKEFFPLDVVFSHHWSSNLCHALFLKWVIVSVATTSSPSSPYQALPLVSQLRVVHIPGDPQILSTCPTTAHLAAAAASGLATPTPSAAAHLALLWSNGLLLACLLHIAEKGSAAAASAATTGYADGEDIEAARIIFELLKRPTLNCPEMLLACLIKRADIISPSVGRPLVLECLDQMWRVVSAKASPQVPRVGGGLEGVALYVRWLASLDPAQFSTVFLGALYARNPDRMEDIAFALKSDIPLLEAVLEGRPTAFRFYLAHLARSPEFHPALWLKERLRNDTEDVAREFLVFLILSLCPIEVLQQKLSPASSAHPIRRLRVTSYDLWLYFVVIVATCSSPGVLAEIGISPSGTLELEDFNGLIYKSRETVKEELFKLKQVAAKLLPQLAGFVHLIQPNDVGSGGLDNAPPVQPGVGGPRLATSAVFEENGATSNRNVKGLASEMTDVNAEVHRHFAALYSEEISTIELVGLMQRLLSGTRQSRGYQVVDTMIKLLFYECRFFPKYPLSELAITAELLGQLIRSGVLAIHGAHGGPTHLLAARCVIEALRKGEGSKMFRFAITALEQLVPSPVLLQYPELIVALATTPDLRRHFPSYAEYADQCLALLPAELRQRQYVDAAALIPFLPHFPTPPPVVVHRGFSLPRGRQAATALGVSGSAALAASGPTAPAGPPAVPGGVPPQRPLVVGGRTISLAGFGLGTVEQLLSADASLQTALDPPQWFKNQVAQIFNSLVAGNLDKKATELRSILQPEWQPYLALYLVKSRASKETNLHEPYMQVIEHIGYQKLLDSVTATTYDCITVLLSYCDAAKESSSYRTVLKNLGAWLGTITLARNRPLKSKLIDLKVLLFDGYENGRLRALLPLCCKIMEGIGHSKSFRPPNPWSVAVFNLLGEIHALENLATPLMFEIEVLFKNLNLTIEDFRGRTQHLAKRVAPGPLSPDFVHRGPPQESPASTDAVPLSDGGGAGQRGGSLMGSSAAGGQLTATTEAAAGSPVAPSPLPPPPPPPCGLSGPSGNASVFSGFDDPKISAAAVTSALASDAALVRTFGPLTASGAQGGSTEGPGAALLVGAADRRVPPTGTAGTTPMAMLQMSQQQPPSGSAPPPSSSLLAGLMKSVVVSPSLVLFQMKPGLKAVIPRAIECAIKEIAQVVAERSVTISCITTREIVLKDFSAEANESLLRRAAHLLVASLAGSLALVTCREPLRASLSQHLRNFLLVASDKLGEDPRLLDQIISVTTADNIELGCALVEEAVVQRALQEIDVALRSALTARAQARLSGQTQFRDPAFFASRWISALPPVLQPRPSLSAEQLQVYKDFLLLGPLHRMQQAGEELRLHQTARDGTVGSASALTKGPAGGVLVAHTPPAGGVNNAAHPNGLLNGAKAALLRTGVMNSASAGSEGSVAPQDGQAGEEAIRTGMLANSRSAALLSGNGNSYRQYVGSLVELQGALMRVEESLAYIKDVVHEIAFCSPLSCDVGSLETRKSFSGFFGLPVDVLEVPQCVNTPLAILARLPSDHEIFSSVASASALCHACKDKESAYISVRQRVLKMIGDVGVLYRNRAVLSRVSDVAELYLEVFLGLLSVVVTGEDAPPMSQVEMDIKAWLPSILHENRFGADVVTGLLRYNLISCEKLDHLLVEACVAALERQETAVFENTLRILYRVATDTEVNVQDLPLALRSLQGCRNIISQLPVGELASGTEASAMEASEAADAEGPGEPGGDGRLTPLKSLLGRTYTSLVATSPPELFGSARERAEKAVIQALGASSGAGSEMRSSYIVEKPKRVATLTSLIEEYATFSSAQRTRVRVVSAPPVLSLEKKTLTTAYFVQWMLCLTVAGAERRSRLWASFFQQLSKHKLLQIDEETDHFLTGCIDYAVQLSKSAAAKPSEAQQNGTMAQPTSQPEEASVNSGLVSGDASVEVSSVRENETSVEVADDQITSPTKQPAGDEQLHQAVELEESELPLRPLDAFAKMIVGMMRLIDPSQISPLLILQRSLAALVRCIFRDASELPAGEFPATAYYRILLSLLWEITQPNRGLDNHTLSCLLCIVNALRVLSPCQCPQFALCWVELIAHRAFLPKMLGHVRAWPHYRHLVVRLFQFLFPFQLHAQFSPGIFALYKGTLRLFLVLLHDFPEFLCENHVILCEHLPFNSVQLRNLILSAFPRNIKLPDPFTPNLKVDLLPETRRAPSLAGYFPLLLLRSGAKKDLDEFWRTRNTTHLQSLLQKIKLTDAASIAKTGSHYDVSLINAILFQLATQLPSDRGPFVSGEGTAEAPAAPAVKVAVYLTQELDEEGRYVLLSCIGNHLRYPNMHTHYFSCLLLWLFGVCAPKDNIQEQITRVLLERLIAHRPHPWGLLITFIELIKNPRFDFWRSPFVHAVPEIQKLFQSVAQTCLGQPKLVAQRPDQQRFQHLTVT